MLLEDILYTEAGVSPGGESVQSSCSTNLKHSDSFVRAESAWFSLGLVQWGDYCKQRVEEEW